MKIYVVEIIKMSGIGRRSFGDLVKAMECERSNHGFAKIYTLTLDMRGDTPTVVSYEPWE